MADLIQKYVNSYNAGYIEAILHILIVKLTFINSAGIGLARLKQLDCFRTAKNSKWRQKWRYKPDVRVSQLLDKIATKFQRLPHIFMVQQLNDTIDDTARCNRMSVIKDGGHQTGSKPEVLISQLLDKIATPFQRLSHIIVVPQLSGTIVDTTRRNRKSVIQDGGRQAG